AHACAVGPQTSHVCLPSLPPRRSSDLPAAVPVSCVNDTTDAPRRSIPAGHHPSSVRIGWLGVHTRSSRSLKLTLTIACGTLRITAATRLYSVRPVFSVKDGTTLPFCKSSIGLPQTVVPARKHSSTMIKSKSPTSRALTSVLQRPHSPHLVRTDPSSLTILFRQGRRYPSVCTLATTTSLFSYSFLDPW